MGRRALGLWALCALVLAGLLAGCSMGMPKDLKPVPRLLVIAMHDKGMDDNSPIFIRIFKEESQLEVWKATRSGQYALLKTYDICKWSGELGPKKVEGDRQAPEGFYTVTPAQMNPDSNYYLSFNIGYPNNFDQALGRTGSNLMVHGACSSAGCYSMTDESAGEIFALARDAFKGGQREFQIQAFPFKMTPENMARHYENPNLAFWRMLKVGYDSFELTRTPPKVDVCEKQYVFNADAHGARFDAAARCPTYAVPEPFATALAKKQSDDDQKVATLVAAAKNGGVGGPFVPVALARPGILDRIGLGGRQEPAATPVTTAPVTAAPAGTAPATTAAVSTPVPTIRNVTPTMSVAPATAKPAASAPVVAAAPATPIPAAAASPVTTLPAPPASGGTMVTKKLWWDDPPTSKDGA